MVGEGLLYNFISFVFTTRIDNVSGDLGTGAVADRDLQIREGEGR